MKVLKEILVVLLSIVSYVFLFGYLFLIGTQNIISKDNIAKLFEHVEIKEIIGEEEFNELNNSFIESGLPDGMVEDILDNKEFKEFVGKYTSDIFSSVLLSDEVILVDAEEVTKDLNNVLDIVIKEAKNNGVEISDSEIKQAHEELNNNIDSLVEDINNNIKDAKREVENSAEDEQVVEMLNVVRNTYKHKTIYLVISVVCIIVSCILKANKLAIASYMRSIGLAFGILLLVIGGALTAIIDLIASSLEEYGSVVSASLKTISNTYLIGGIACLVIGIISIVGIIYIKKQKSENTGI